MSGALLVFAKEPRAGEVKTRLCPPLTPEQAAELYACMLDDVLEASAAEAKALGLAPLLLVAPASACGRLAVRAPGWRVLAQRGPDLGARMERAAADAAALGHAPLLLRGSDTPALEPAVLREGLEALAEVDLALSPAPDGGYGLVALRRAAPGLFSHPMSTPRVLDDTLARARALGLRARLLAPSFDLDVAADLALLERARREGRARCCPRTLAWLDAHALPPAATRAG